MARPATPDTEREGSMSPGMAPGVLPFLSTVHDAQFIRDVKGRSYNIQNESYMLPVDSEEQDRQSIEHRALTLALDSLYAAPDFVKRSLAPRQDYTPAILDVGTGSGVWAMDMAQEFPHADVVGLDLVPPIVDINNIPFNCRFEVDDINLDLSHFADSFNVIHVRCVSQGIADHRETIHRLAETLRTDGVLLLIAGTHTLYNEHQIALPPMPDVPSAVGGGKGRIEGMGEWCAFQAFLTAVDEVGQKRGGDVKGSDHWVRWLIDSPMYTNVGIQDIYVPIGPWQPHLDERCKLIAELIQQDSYRYIDMFRPFLTNEGYDEAMLDRWAIEAEKEVRTMSPKVFCKFRYVWATRSKTHWMPY